MFNLTRKRTKDLKLEDKKLEIVTQNMIEGAILLDKEKTVVFTNLKARIMLGSATLRSNDTISTFNKVFNLDIIHRLEPLNEYLVLRTEEVEIDGKTFNISFNYIQSKDDSYYLVWIWDITQFKLLEKAKSEFVTIAAHQLRTPLSGIKWSLNLFLNGELGSITDEQKTFFKKVYHTNERMIQSVNEILSTDRVETEVIDYSFQRCATLFDIIDSVLLDLQPLIEKSNITIDVTRTALPEVYIDIDKIRLVFQNLIENAVKYTVVNGTIKIRTEARDEKVTISISDTGIGIPSDQQGNIFKRFYRASNARQVHTDGSGLGLFLVRKIVETHKGKTWFESAEGKGTTFFVQLPIYH